MPTAIPSSAPFPPPILIIEDNDDHLSLTLEALEEAGVRNPIHAATSVQTARARLQEYEQQGLTFSTGLPCLILLDIRLPDGSGMDLLRELKQNSVLSPIPVVILTSSADTPDIKRAYLLGANSYLVKPIVFDEFHLKVREAGLYWALLNQPRKD
jgi:CheY-like chemotaxis protein